MTQPTRRIALGTPFSPCFPEIRWPPSKHPNQQWSRFQLFLTLLLAAFAVFVLLNFMYFEFIWIGVVAVVVYISCIGFLLQHFRLGNDRLTHLAIRRHMILGVVCLIELCVLLALQLALLIPLGMNFFYLAGQRRVPIFLTPLVVQRVPHFQQAFEAGNYRKLAPPELIDKPHTSYSAGYISSVIRFTTPFMTLETLVTGTTLIGLIVMLKRLATLAKEYKCVHDFSVGGNLSAISNPTEHRIEISDASPRRPTELSSGTTTPRKSLCGMYQNGIDTIAKLGSSPSYHQGSPCDTSSTGGPSRAKYIPEECPESHSPLPLRGIDLQNRLPVSSPSPGLSSSRINDVACTNSGSNPMRNLRLGEQILYTSSSVQSGIFPPQNGLEDSRVEAAASRSPSFCENDWIRHPFQHRNGPVRLKEEYTRNSPFSHPPNLGYATLGGPSSMEMKSASPTFGKSGPIEAMSGLCGCSETSPSQSRNSSRAASKQDARESPYSQVSLVEQPGSDEDLSETGKISRGQQPSSRRQEEGDMEEDTSPLIISQRTPGGTSVPGLPDTIRDTQCKSEQNVQGHKLKFQGYRVVGRQEKEKDQALTPLSPSPSLLPPPLYPIKTSTHNSRGESKSPSIVDGENGSD